MTGNDNQTTVLIVEDDAATRSAARRVFPPDVYRTLEAACGRDAITLLGSERPSVMVLDLGLPDVDGAALWRLLRERDRAVPTVVYTGRMVSGELRAELVRGGVRVVEKGTGSDALLENVEALLGKRWSTKPLLQEDAPKVELPPFRTALRKKLERRALQEIEIPVLDNRVSELQKFVQDDSAAMGPILEIVGNDPRLAAAVLEMVNSAFFSSPTPVTDLRRACIQLGAKRVATLAMQIILQGTFSISREPFRFMMREIWIESIISARFAHKVALYSDLNNADEIYTLALLHNIGELLIVDVASQLPNEVGEEEEEVLREQIERNHERVGQVLMERWELPELIHRVCGSHHRIAEGDSSWTAQLGRIVLGSWELSSALVGFRGVQFTQHDARFRELGLPGGISQKLIDEGRPWPGQLRR